MSIEIVRREGAGLGDPAALSQADRLWQIYRSRGVDGREQLQYSLSRLLPPDELLGIDRAVALLRDAMARELSIVVVGDFDVDGATSTALALLALRAMGHRRVDYLVPNRFKTGYGLTPAIAAQAAARGAGLIITVDNGIASHEGVAAAARHGIEVLVTDHHLPGEKLPPAAAIVNPNQPGCRFGSKALAGVGVIFYVMMALRRALASGGWFERQGIAVPNMAAYLDLLALGTVADVVPLDYNNRILVHQGVQRIRAGQSRPGLLALLNIAGRRHSDIVAADLGFAVGPRLNAAGRLDDMSHGIQCLLAESAADAKRLAVELDGLNSERRDIEAQMQQQAVACVESIDLSAQSLPSGLCLYEPGWHQGVVGIVAARLRERYHRPAIAFADAGEGIIKGSARSVPALHIRDALDAVAAAHPGLLHKFGGHAMAAGMELSLADFPRFAEAFDDAVAAELSPAELRGRIVSDGELAPEQLGLAFARMLRDGGPWGQHFPEPVFDGLFALQSQRLLGGRHLKFTVAPECAPAHTLDAIWFNADVERWPAPDLQRVRIAYRLDVNEFRGFVGPQLIVQHLAALD